MIKTLAGVLVTGAVAAGVVIASQSATADVPVATMAAQTFDNCTEARVAGRTNIPASDPAYKKSMDRDRDGFACDNDDDQNVTPVKNPDLQEKFTPGRSVSVPK